MAVENPPLFINERTRWSFSIANCNKLPEGWGYFVESKGYSWAPGGAEAGCCRRSGEDFTGKISVGFHSHGGYPIAGWFIGENPIYKWMITGGTPMTSESTMYFMEHAWFPMYIYIYLYLFIFQWTFQQTVKQIRISVKTVLARC